MKFPGIIDLCREIIYNRRWEGNIKIKKQIKTILITFFCIICVSSITLAANDVTSITLTPNNIAVQKPAKVRNVKIVQETYNKVKITWNKQNNVTGYKIYRATSKKGKYKKIKIAKTNYAYDSGLKLNKLYYYKVVAYKASNGKDYYGKYSAIVSKKTKLIKPSIEVTVEGNKALKISYSKTKYADFYQIYRAKAGGDYQYIKKTEDRTYIDKNLAGNTKYYYKVRAVKKVQSGKIYSKFSNIKYQTTKDERNAKTKLKLISSYGDNEAYHPDVLYFENGWHGYKYWLAFTPYPNIEGSTAAGDAKKENPHIRVSNNMVDWEIPSEEANPLDEPDFENIDYAIYNSDSELVYNTDLDRIECFWRTYTGSIVYLYMRYTEDGQEWSDKTLIYQVQNVGNTLLSPTIIYDNGNYKMWYVQEYVIKYKQFDSLPFTDATEESDIDVEAKNAIVYPWHLDVIETEGKYRMLYVGTTKMDHIRYMSLYYSESIDGLEWSKATKILEPSTYATAWDNRGIYRSSFFYKDGNYYIFYSASNKQNIKGTGLVYGNKVTDLHPFTK